LCWKISFDFLKRFEYVKRFFSEIKSGLNLTDRDYIIQAQAGKVLTNLVKLMWNLSITKKHCESNNSVEKYEASQKCDDVTKTS
jgi:hypothetical protein